MSKKVRCDAEVAEYLVKWREDGAYLRHISIGVRKVPGASRYRWTKKQSRALRLTREQIRVLMPRSWHRDRNIRIVRLVPR